MNGHSSDWEISRLRTEKDRLLTEKSNDVWRTALKKISQDTRNVYEKKFLKEAQTQNEPSPESSPIKHEVALFRHALITGAVQILKQPGTSVSLHSLSEFLSRGRYSMDEATITAWNAKKASYPDEKPYIVPNIRRVRNALIYLWTETNRTTPPTIQEIATVTSLTKDEVKNVLQGSHDSANLRNLREMGPKKNDSFHL